MVQPKLVRSYKWLDALRIEFGLRFHLEADETMPKPQQRQTWRMALGEVIRPPEDHGCSAFWYLFVVSSGVRLVAAHPKTSGLYAAQLFSAFSSTTKHFTSLPPLAQPCLPKHVVQRTRRNVISWVSSSGDTPHLICVLELTVAAALADQIPTIFPRQI